VTISNEQFSGLVLEAIEAIAPKYKSRLENVAFIVEDRPSEEQRIKTGLAAGQTLLGLYEGVPLPSRNGAAKILPDKITLFKEPLLAGSTNLAELKESIRHTIWHEIAHYFGLDHDRIYELEGREKE
jgi:predicted Zn-dependent protease with MMP-like domain